MEIWKTILMGVVEGLTEFLPVSSTGHMILVGHWIHFPEELGKTFDVFIQLGAILAVVVYFRGRLRDWGSSFDPRHPLGHPITVVMIAFMPAAIVGFLTHKWVQAHLFHPLTVAVALIAGGVAIDVIERTRKGATVLSVEKVPIDLAIKIGLFQCVALFPGVSRSAATIMGGLLVGLSMPAAAEFSFFLAIPTMVAASGYSLLKVAGRLSGGDVLHLAIGFTVAFAVALAVVAAFMRYIQTNSFRPFAIYRIVLGIVVIVVVALG